MSWEKSAGLQVSLENGENEQSRQNKNTLYIWLYHVFNLSIVSIFGYLNDFDRTYVFL